MIISTVQLKVCILEFDFIFNQNRENWMSQEKQFRQYFHAKVNPVFQPLLYNLVKQRPQDILAFCIRWFKEDKGNQESDDSDAQSNFADVPDEQFDSWRLKRIANPTRKIRTAICSQVYGPFHKRNVISLRKGQPKDQNIQMKMLFYFMSSFLFIDFSQEEKKLLIENMIERPVSLGQKIIVQGQYGDQMYLVAEGQFQCYQQGPMGRRVLKTYKSGDIFGELCILHNSVRLTTIKARTSGFLYCLDRKIYQHVKKLSIVKKRTLYAQTMRKVKIFDNFERDELQKICDVFTEVSYEPGKTVIVEGDTGTKFYIVLEGVLVAYKGKSETLVQCFKQGDYFGELALLNDTPRQASVRAVTNCTLVCLTQDVFKRIINRQKIQKEIAQKYKQKKNVLIKRRGQDKN